MAAPGPTRLIDTKKDHLTRADKAIVSGPAPEGLSRQAAMAHALRTPKGATSPNNVPGRSNLALGTSSTTWVSAAFPGGGGKQPGPNGTS